MITCRFVENFIKVCRHDILLCRILMNHFSLKHHFDATHFNVDSHADVRQRYPILIVIFFSL